MIGEDNVIHVQQVRVHVELWIDEEEHWHVDLATQSTTGMSIWQHRVLQAYRSGNTELYDRHVDLATYVDLAT